MTRLTALACVAALTTGLVLAETITFDDLKTGAPPPGWTATRTGKGEAHWEVVPTTPPPANPMS